jgi:hypothetical protein
MLCHMMVTPLFEPWSRRIFKAQMGEFVFVLEGPA